VRFWRRCCAKRPPTLSSATSAATTSSSSPIWILRGLLRRNHSPLRHRHSELLQEEHRQRGYIEATNRQGEPVRYPIMTLSIGVVTNAQRTFTDAMQVSNLAAEMKKYAKGISGSVFRVDRRGSEGAEPAVAGATPLPSTSERPATGGSGGSGR
jgi:hypothetical protein